MKLIYEGKTKNVYENVDGTITLKLKDDATGKDGVFDPGENTVGLSIDGLGRESLRLSAYYFELLAARGIPTHYISHDLDEVSMTVRPAKIFGRGVEFVCRAKADGSFVRRYGAYVKKGDDLPLLVEVTLKDDAGADPPITRDALVALGIMTVEEYDACVNLTQEITKIIAEDLAKKGLTLYDIKYEFGKMSSADIENGLHGKNKFVANCDVFVMDEFSAGVMRVYKNGVIVPPMELAKLVLNPA